MPLALIDGVVPVIAPVFKIPPIVVAVPETCMPLIILLDVEIILPVDNKLLIPIQEDVPVVEVGVVAALDKFAPVNK